MALFDSSRQCVYVGAFGDLALAVASLCVKHGRDAVSGLRQEEFPGEVFEDGEGRRWTPAAAPPAWRGGFPMGGGRVVAPAALGARSPHDWTPVAYASYLAPQNVPILPPRPSFQFAGGAAVEPVSPIAPPRGRAPYQFRAAAPPDPRLRRVGAPLEPASPKRAAVEGGGWVAPRRFARPPELAPARAPRPSQSDALDEPEPLEQPPLSAAGPHRIVHGVLGLAKAPTFDRGRAVAAPVSYTHLTLPTKA